SRLAGRDETSSARPQSISVFVSIRPSRRGFPQAGRGGFLPRPPEGGSAASETAKPEVSPPWRRLAGGCSRRLLVSQGSPHAAAATDLTRHRPAILPGLLAAVSLAALSPGAARAQAPVVDAPANASARSYGE